MSKEPKQQDKSTTRLVEDIKEKFGIDIEKITETVVKDCMKKYPDLKLWPAAGGDRAAGISLK